MKKLVSAAVIAALVAGTASAEVKLRANARVQSNILKSTMAKSDSDSNHNDWLNLKGWGDAKDSVSISAKEDFGGLDITTTINSTTVDEKYATFDTYDAWLKFGSFTLKAGKYGTRNADRPRNNVTDVNLLDGDQGKWGINPKFSGNGSTGYYGKDFDNITAISGTSKLSFLGSYEIKDVLPGSLTFFLGAVENQTASSSYTTKTTTEVELSKDGKEATATSTSTTKASTGDTVVYYHDYSKNKVYSGCSFAALYNQKDVVKLEAVVRSFTEDVFGAGLYANLLMVENMNIGLGFTFLNDSTENAKNSAWAVQTMTSYKISDEMIATLQARYSSYKAEDVDADTALELVAGVRYVASDTFRCGLEAGVYMDDLDDNDETANGKNHLTVFPTVQVNSGKNAYFCTGVSFDTKLDTGDMKDTATVTTVTVPFIVRVKM